MTIKDIKNGTPFIYKNRTYTMVTVEISEYNSEVTYYLQDEYIGHIANIDKIGSKVLSAYTYILGRRVAVKINIKDCKPVTNI